MQLDKETYPDMKTREIFRTRIQNLGLRELIKISGRKEIRTLINYADSLGT